MSLDVQCLSRPVKQLYAVSEEESLSQIQDVILRAEEPTSTRSETEIQSLVGTEEKPGPDCSPKEKHVQVRQLSAS